jgi:hypothetical protein
MKSLQSFPPQYIFLSTNRKLYSLKKKTLWLTVFEKDAPFQKSVLCRAEARQISGAVILSTALRKSGFYASLYKSCKELSNFSIYFG